MGETDLNARQMVSCRIKKTTPSSEYLYLPSGWIFSDDSLGLTKGPPPATVSYSCCCCPTTSQPQPQPTTATATATCACLCCSCCLLLLLHLPRSQLLLVWEPCTLPHTRQSPPAPTLVLHAAAAPPCRLLLLPMLLLLPQALAGSTLGAWLTLGTRQPPRPP